MFRTFVSGIGSVLMSVSAWLMGETGLLFNWIVTDTVVQFGTTYQGALDTGVTAAWTAFRDLANMLIIGLFVFIAISLILGLREFGQKKYIARAIMVAILINFSLLFTKMIVDFSNFAAFQFYAAASNTIGGVQNAGSTQATGGSTITGNLGAKDAAGNYIASSTLSGTPGIAGAFIRMTGVAGIGAEYGALNKIAQNSDSGWLALLHGLVASTLFLSVASVLLYGSYILVVRAILIVVLLMLSALAFATYIIPNRQWVEKGWSLWWSSLIRVAVLAPLLMVMLWATAGIATQFAHGGNTLAELASNPSSASNIQALLNFIIVLGLLYVSIRVSNSVASKIAGFDTIGAVIGGAARVGVAVATGNPLALAMRSRFAANSTGDAAAKNQEARLQTGLYGNQYQAALGKASKAKTPEEKRAALAEAQVARTNLGQSNREVFRTDAQLQKRKNSISATRGAAASETATDRSAIPAADRQRAAEDLKMEKERLYKENTEYARHVDAGRDGTDQIAKVVETAVRESANKEVKIDRDSLHAALSDPRADGSKPNLDDELKKTIKAAMGGESVSDEDVNTIKKRVDSFSSQMSEAHHRIEEARSKAIELENADPRVAQAKATLVQHQAAQAAKPAESAPQSATRPPNELIDPAALAHAVEYIRSTHGQEQVAIHAKNVTMHLSQQPYQTKTENAPGAPQPEAFSAPPWSHTPTKTVTVNIKPINPGNGPSGPRSGNA